MRKGLTQRDYKEAALVLGCEVEVIEAVAKVESRSSGFNKDGSPKILFEAHIFYSEIKKLGLRPEDYQEGNEDIIQKSWSKGSKYYKGGIAEYSRLDKAFMLFPEAALKSASYGKFQIMGFNHDKCGYSDVINFVLAMDLDVNTHLRAFVSFVKYRKIDKYLRSKNWAKFAYYYNGAGYAKHNYDGKMEQEYKKLKGIG
ncbi:N-acetylmuramidase family protein [Aquimarina sp. 2-A2]|uniref:N-acetylmuramidase family protein n=1 Tax=Aquimarina sp. 2-A2 TaxID=3382644 RepID=UPI00387F1268